MAAWAVANALHLFSVTAVVPGALLFGAVAVIFWQESKRQETLADRLLGLSFMAWCVLQLAVFFFLRSAPAELAIDSPISAVRSPLVGMVMGIAPWRGGKRGIRGDILAASNMQFGDSVFLGRWGSRRPWQA